MPRRRGKKGGSVSSTSERDADTVGSLVGAASAAVDALCAAGPPSRPAALAAALDALAGAAAALFGSGTNPRTLLMLYAKALAAVKDSAALAAAAAKVCDRAGEPGIAYTLYKRAVRLDPDDGVSREAGRALTSRTINRVRVWWRGGGRLGGVGWMGGRAPAGTAGPRAPLLACGRGWWEQGLRRKEAGRRAAHPPPLSLLRPPPFACVSGTGACWPTATATRRTQRPSGARWRAGGTPACWTWAQGRRCWRCWRCVRCKGQCALRCAV